MNGALLFLIGMLVGATIGILVVGLCRAASQGDEP